MKFRDQTIKNGLKYTTKYLTNKKRVLFLET